jgi:uncharacterized protein HemY
MSDHQEWLTSIAHYFKTKGKKGGNIVLFPGYRPDLSSELARQLNLEFFDYREEVMQEFRQDADTIGLNQLTETLHARVAKNGIVAHNIEALLCVKSEAERRTWIQSFLDTDWDNPIFVPISIYQADVPEEHQRVCDLELLKMPGRKEPPTSQTNERIKYDV